MTDLVDAEKEFSNVAGKLKAMKKTLEAAQSRVGALEKGLGIKSSTMNRVTAVQTSTATVPATRTATQIESTMRAEGLCSPGGMYEMAPIYAGMPPIENQASCMYTMAPTGVVDVVDPGLNHSANTSSSNGQIVGSSREQALEARQNKLIADLEAMVAAVEAKLVANGVPVPPRETFGGAAVAVKLDKHGHARPTAESARPCSATSEISIFSDPSAAPASALLLAKILETQGCVVDIRQYWHCGAGDGGPGVQEKIKEYRRRPRVTCDLRINLIWKKDSVVKLVVSPSSHTPIIGEGNVARFITRKFLPALYPADDYVAATLIDGFVEKAAGLGGNARNQKLALKDPNTVLGKQDFLVGSSLSLADVMLYSAIDAAGITLKDKNLKRWKQALEQLPAFV